jgi:hypothetical protein
MAYFIKFRPEVPELKHADRERETQPYIYAGSNWKLRTHFGHEFHIPKQEKISISTCVRKHLISEFWLKEYICSKCWDCPLCWLEFRCQHETRTGRVKCFAHDHLEGPAWTVALSLPFTSAGPHACWFSNARELCRGFVQRSAEHFFVSTMPYTHNARFGASDIVNRSALMYEQGLLLIVR